MLILCLLQECNLLPRLCSLLQHKNGDVRARVCSLVGNLFRWVALAFAASMSTSMIIAATLHIDSACRHNDTFLRAISSSSSSSSSPPSLLLPLIISAASDTDEHTRKFAAFAIGNAGVPAPRPCGSGYKVTPFAAFHSDALYPQVLILLLVCAFGSG